MGDRSNSSRRASTRPMTTQLKEEKVPAESVIYLIDESTLPGALGYHDLNTRDFPVGFVFVLDPNDWTTTLSHEVLELILQ